MMAIKDDLFTIRGLILTVLHNLFIIGTLAAIVGFRVYVLGIPPLR